MTYVSAIYEYNLSVRPDYDRDVAKKKASAIFYKFDIQHAVAMRTVNFVTSMVKADGSRVDPTFPQPNTIFAASYDDCEDKSLCKTDKMHTSTLFFRQDDGTAVPVYLRPECAGCKICDGLDEDCDGDSSIWADEDGNAYERVLLTLEQSLYNEDEMASKLLCLNKKLHEDDIESCSSDSYRDGEGNLTGTCCGTDEGHRVLVSYKSVDPRWLNRLTNSVNLDFWRAMEDRAWYTNLGIIQWDEDKDRWIFNGKTSLYASYYDRLQEWNAQEAEKVANDSSGTYVEEKMPKYLRRITSWELPEFFDEDFFVAYDGVTDLCKRNGCIFRINEM